MIQTRQGVFETNSSSTHSIVVCRRNTPKEYGFLFISIGEYGWEVNTLTTPSERASYFYTLACDFLCRDVADDIWRVMCKYGIDCEFTDHAHFDKDGYLDNGYVDHCGEGQEFVEAMLHSEKRMIDFFFNPGSLVRTANDNCWGDDDPCYLNPADYPDSEFYYKGN